MVKYYCDRCHKHLEEYDIFGIEIVPPEIGTWTDDAMTGRWHLCRNCEKALIKWLGEDNPFENRFGK